MSRFIRASLTILFTGCLLACAGCGEDPVAAPVGQMALEPDMMPDGSPDQQPDNLPDQTLLSIIGDSVMELAFDSRGGMTVQLTTTDGEALPNVTLSFEVLGATAGPSLESATAITDSKGQATNNLFAGRVEGLFEVLVTGPNANPVKYTVFVFPSDEAGVRVASSYSGQTRLANVEVKLLDSSVRCQNVTVQAIPAAVQTQDVPVGVGQPIPDAVFSDLPNGTGYTVVVVGMVDPGLPAALGCNDAGETIADGMGVRVEVELRDVAPNISGSYAILTRLNLTDGLPEPWSTNVQFVGEIFADPVRSLVDFLFGDPNDNGDGFLGRFLDDTPSRRTLVTGALTDLILATDIGQRLDRFFGVGGEAYRVVTEFGMAGTMDIRSEPGEDGQLGSNNGHRYDDIVIDWTIDCDPNDLECSRVVVNLSSIDNVGALSSTFSGEVGQGPRLFVDRHGFEFNYGAIAVAIMERVVLPRTFGVNSIEGALGLLVDCDDFGDSIFPNNVVFSLGVSEACEFALEAVADEVVERLSGANLGLPDLTLATFGTEAGLERAGCLMGEPEYTSQDVLRRVSTLGSEQTRCEWDALFETSDGTGAVRSDFHATGR